MLRIIHTGRAYEVLDRVPTIYSRPSQERELRRLTAKCTILWLRYRQQNDILGETCREVWRLKELLKNTINRNLELQIKLKSCQKSTLDTHESRDPEALLDDLHSLNMRLMAEAWRLKDTHHVEEKS